MKKIVVGLGNPGSRYEKTRHNIGWMVLDRLADGSGASGRAKTKDAAATVRGRLGDDELILVKPMTYMNASGEAVRKVLARERAPLADVLVVVDDMALPFGRLRMKARGSAGGHNGLRSIIARDGHRVLRPAARSASEHRKGQRCSTCWATSSTPSSATSTSSSTRRPMLWSCGPPTGLTRSPIAGMAGSQTWCQKRRPTVPTRMRQTTRRRQPRATLQQPGRPSRLAAGAAHRSPMRRASSGRRTGWRKLLPDILAGDGGDEPR